MEEKRMMNFIDETGEEKTAEIILAFEAGTPAKKYVIYTLNQVVNDMVTMYAAIMSKDGNNVYLDNIEDEEEWKMVKNVMRDIAKEAKEVS